MLARVNLIVELVRRDMTRMFQGSFLGFGWAVLTPVLMLTLYSLVFVGVFRVSWRADDASGPLFAVMLYVGLIIHGAFAECVVRSPNAVLDEAAVLRKIAFPPEVLSIVIVIEVLIQAVINLVVLLLMMVGFEFDVPWSALAIPMILIPFVVLLTGLSWMLAAIAVFFRDLRHVTGAIATAFLFLSPVFFPVERLPVMVQPFIRLNPLTIPIEQARLALIEGVWPDLGVLGLYSVVASVIAVSGYVTFSKLSRGFADVL